MSSVPNEADDIAPLLKFKENLKMISVLFSEFLTNDQHPPSQKKAIFRLRNCTFNIHLYSIFYMYN